MNIDKRREIIGGSVFFVFAATYFIMAFDIRQYNDGFLSSDFIPKVYGIILIILSVLQILFGMWKHKKTDDEETNTSAIFDLGRLSSVVVTFILLLAYILLLRTIGFIIMSSLFVFTMTLMLYPRTERNIRRLCKVVIVACLFSTLVYLLFVKGFALTLPAGILG